MRWRHAARLGIWYRGAVMTMPAEPLPGAPVNGALSRDRSLGSVVADLIALTKPRITWIVVGTMLGGAWVANRYMRERGLPEASMSVVALALLGTVLVV